MAIRSSGTSNGVYQSKLALTKPLPRPVPSPDGCLLALIVPQLGIQILSLLHNHRGDRVIKTISFPKEYLIFLQRVDILRWSPETMIEAENGVSIQGTSKVVFGQNWLLLAGERRLVALRIDLSNRALSSQAPDDFNSIVICDVEFPEHYGKITAAEFVGDHEDVFLLFDMNLHGSLLSLVKAERYDLKDVKFHTSQSFATDPAGKYLAVLRRQKGRDQVTVFDLKGAERTPYTFECRPFDTQGIKWSPDGKPVLIIWDSSAFGTLVQFFTATGHPLRSLDLNWRPSVPTPALSDGKGPGITTIEWSIQGGSSTHIILAVGNGSRNVVYRCQKTQSLGVEVEVTINHPDNINGTDCVIWQEQHDDQFHKEAGLIETASTEQDVEIVTTNADGGMFATKVSWLPRTVWIWQAGQRKPSFVISLKEEIKQLLWHPTLASILAILTKAKSPMVRVWYDKENPPVAGDIHFADAIPASSWKACWVHQNHAEHQLDQLFMISSIKQHQIGYLGVSKGQLSFQSVLDGPFLDDEEPSTMLDTPSKPGRLEKNTVIEGMLCGRTESDIYWFSGSR